MLERVHAFVSALLKPVFTAMISASVGAHDLGRVSVHLFVRVRVFSCMRACVLVFGCAARVCAHVCVRSYSLLKPVFTAMILRVWGRTIWAA